ncbi:hypothetical protein AB0H76_11785 [Nocardia sp. NPDC050712]|uniref:baeRF11 domain-containing protein n=1 Tax=Nocardia sp. NPDC050712 TaxID=3155518 RepID=UPI0033E65144
MRHTDIPTHGEVVALAAENTPWCVSVYTPTEVDTPTPDRNRVAFENQAKQALGLVEDKAARTALEEEFADLAADEDYWRYQSRTLAVLATPDRMRTFRVPNNLSASTTVGSRFAIKPLLRTVTFPQEAYVLALAENAVRLVAVTADRPARDVSVPDLPPGLNDYLDLPPLGRNPHGRLQGGEGRKVRIRQYCRAVEHALRNMLSGSDTPLILAAAEPTASLYRSVNSYPGLLAEGLPGNPERVSDTEIAEHVRTLLDQHYAEELTELRTEFEKRRGDGRGLVELTDIARAATFGIVQTLFVDIDAVVPGTIGADGAIAYPDDAPDLLDDIARRVLLANGRVLAVRADDIPDGVPVAAILRYAG